MASSVIGHHDWWAHLDSLRPSSTPTSGSKDGAGSFLDAVNNASGASHGAGKAGASQTGASSFDDVDFQHMLALFGHRAGSAEHADAAASATSSAQDGADASTTSVSGSVGSNLLSGAASVMALLTGWPSTGADIAAKGASAASSSQTGLAGTDSGARLQTWFSDRQNTGPSMDPWRQQAGIAAYSSGEIAGLVSKAPIAQQSISV